MEHSSISVTWWWFMNIYLPSWTQREDSASCQLCRRAAGSILPCSSECVTCMKPAQFNKGFLRVTYHFKSVRAPRWAPHLFFSHNIFLLPCMACCRGNRPENGLAFPALPGESTHADMQLTTTHCMSGSGIFFPKQHFPLKKDSPSSIIVLFSQAKEIAYAFLFNFCCCFDMKYVIKDVSPFFWGK